jgi:hypothetical protein
MGAVQIPDHLRQLIDRQVAEGRATSEADYVVKAQHAYAEHLDHYHGSAFLGLLEFQDGALSATTADADLDRPPSAMTLPSACP